MVVNLSDLLKCFQQTILEQNWIALVELFNHELDVAILVKGEIILSKATGPCSVSALHMHVLKKPRLQTYKFIYNKNK